MTFRIVPGEGMNEFRGVPLTESEQRLMRLAREQQQRADAIMEQYGQVEGAKHAELNAVAAKFDPELTGLSELFRMLVADANALVFQTLAAAQKRTAPQSRRRSGRGTRGQVAA